MRQLNRKALLGLLVEVANEMALEGNVETSTAKIEAIKVEGKEMHKEQILAWSKERLSK